MRTLKATLKSIQAAAEVVKKGGFVVYPTDTVYGLGCDPFNTNAVETLIRVKGGRDKPLSILASSLTHVERIAKLSNKARRIGDKFWPGPLTLVLPVKHVSTTVSLGLGTVGVRIPNHKVALKLVQLSGGLLVGTSANKTGAPPPSTAAEAYRQLKDEVDIILDGGRVEIGESSTVLDMTTEKIKVLREGPVKLEAVLRV